MTTTERYSKTNAPSNRMASTHLPLWKQQLLERKTVNERIKKQSESRKARVSLTDLDGSGDHNVLNTTAPPALPSLASSYPVISTNNDSVDGHSMIKPSSVKQQQSPTKTHANLLSPQPYKNRLRNNIPVDAHVVEEAVVSVRDNPFRHLENKNVLKASPIVKSRTAHSKVREPPEEPIYVNASSLRSRAPQRSDSAQASLSVSSGSPTGSEFTQVRSLWENIESPNKPTDKFSPKPYNPRKALSSSSADAKTSGPFYAKRSYVVPQIRTDIPEPETYENLNIVSSYVAVPVNKDGVLDYSQNELPLPNTVSNLKSVYESKPRLRDKTPPPAGFKRIRTGNINSAKRTETNDTVNVRSDFKRPSRTMRGTHISSDEKPTATVKPVVFAAKETPHVYTNFKDHNADALKVNSFDNKKLKQTTTHISPVKTADSSVKLLSNTTTIGERHRDVLCVENYVPKFVNEYTSHRITSVLNSIIKDSFNYRVIPKAVTHHKPKLVLVTKSLDEYNADCDASAAATVSSISVASHYQPPSSLSYHTSSTTSVTTITDSNAVLHTNQRMEMSFEPPGSPPSQVMLTPEVILIEKPSTETTCSIQSTSHIEARDDLTTLDDDRLKSFPSLSNEQETKSIEVEDDTHPQIVVFERDTLLSANVTLPTSMKVVPKEDNPMGSDLVEVDSMGLPVITSFKEQTSNERISATQVPIEQSIVSGDSNRQLIIIAEPPPKSLKSCINQKSKSSDGRKLSFFEDVYVHEYPVVFWTSEEELHLVEMEEEAEKRLKSAAAASSSSSAAPSSDLIREDRVGEIVFEEEENVRDATDGAPLAAPEDEMDIFSPLGSNSDITKNSGASVNISLNKDYLQMSKNVVIQEKGNSLGSYQVPPSVLLDQCENIPSNNDVNNNSKKRAPILSNVKLRYSNHTNSHSQPTPAKRTASSTVKDANEDFGTQVRVLSSGARGKSGSYDDEINKVTSSNEHGGSLDDLIAIDDDVESVDGESLSNHVNLKTATSSKPNASNTSPNAQQNNNALTEQLIRSALANTNNDQQSSSSLSFSQSKHRTKITSHPTDTAMLF